MRSIPSFFSQSSTRFDLFDQLLDPKMDPSFGAEKVVSFEEARAKGLLKPTSTLSVETMVGLCDHLLMAEVRTFPFLVQLTSPKLGE